MPIAQTIAEKISGFLDFFSEWQPPKFGTARTVKRVELRHRAKFRQNRLNRGRDMAIFNFQNGGRRHLGFWKLQISNCETCHECRIASPCQISSKSLQPRLRYDDFFDLSRWRPSAILDLMRVLGPATKGIWWSLSLCKIWLESI